MKSIDRLSRPLMLTTLLCVAPVSAAAQATPTPASTDAAGSEASAGFYYTDDAEDEEVVEFESTLDTGADTHTVRSGDTLWDLAQLYFQSSWEWPKLWSYNPQVTNPHWIYPGDILHLRAARTDPEGAPRDLLASGDPLSRQASTGDDNASNAPARSSRVLVTQYGFIAEGESATSGEIVGSREERELLAAGDVAYISGTEQSALEPGQRYSLYKDPREVRHPETGKVVGHYVDLLGEVQVLTAPGEVLGRAIITRQTAPIERGTRIGPYMSTTQRVEEHFGNLQVDEVMVVAELRSEELIGAERTVILDAGSAAGVQLGHRLYVYRRGDNFRTEMPPPRRPGQNDERYPRRILAELIVVQVGESTSCAVVTASYSEFEVGDRVRAHGND